MIATIRAMNASQSLHLGDIVQVQEEMAVEAVTSLGLGPADPLTTAIQAAVVKGACERLTAVGTSEPTVASLAALAQEAIAEFGPDAILRLEMPDRTTRPPGRIATVISATMAAIHRAIDARRSGRPSAA
jgi:hypothetical protein